MQINKLYLSFANLNIQPALQLTYQNNQSTTKSKKIEIKIYKYIDESFEEGLIINQTLQTAQSFEELYNEYKTNNSVYTDTVVNALKSIWGALTSSGMIIKQLNKNSENLNFHYTIPLENADNQFYFSDLKIKFKEYGQYQMIFIVDGIESQLSPIIIVSQGMDESHTSQREVSLKTINLFQKIN